MSLLKKYCGWIASVLFLSGLLSLLYWDEAKTLISQNESRGLVFASDQALFADKLQELWIKSRDSVPLKLGADESQEFWQTLARIKYVKRFSIHSISDVGLYGFLNPDKEVQISFLSGKSLQIKFGERLLTSYGVYAYLPHDPLSVYIVSQHVLLMLNGMIERLKFESTLPESMQAKRN